jgi:hypothetical protein
MGLLPLAIDAYRPLIGPAAIENTTSLRDKPHCQYLLPTAE